MERQRATARIERQQEAIDELTLTFGHENEELLHQLEVTREANKQRVISLPIIEDQADETGRSADETGRSADETEQLNVELAEWIANQTQIVAGLPELTRGQLGLNNLMSQFVDELNERVVTFEDMAEGEKELTEERIAQINAEVDAAMAAYTFEQEAFAAMEEEKRRIAEEVAAREAQLLQQRQRRIESFSRSVVGSFATTFGSMMTKVVEGTATIWAAFKEAGKAAIAAVLEALGQMAIVKAALALAEAIGAWPRFAKMAASAAAALKFTAAAALAYGAAGAVRGLEFGGLITEPVVGRGTQTGTTYAIAEKGPEYVSPPGERGEESGGPMQGDVYLDGRKVGRWIQSLIDDQDILLDKGAYAR